MLPPRHRPRFQGKLRGNGLATLVATDDFACWHAGVASTLGHHRSLLLSAAEPFAAQIRAGQLGGLTVLHLQGRGRLRLSREQLGHSVLWLPLQGLSQERINGQEWLAEPGSALLFQPGDAMEGDTSAELEGLSILIPEEHHPAVQRLSVPLLAAGVLEQRLLWLARQLAVAAAQRPPGAVHAADQFLDGLRELADQRQQSPQRERITSRRRRLTVEQAREWMALRLGERFGLLELSAALAISPRQLQYSFQQELGRSPMAEAKRLRLRQLRFLLRDPAQDGRSVAQLMAASGLLASGGTAAEYRHWCGESPRDTRQSRPSTHRQATELLEMLPESG